MPIALIGASKACIHSTRFDADSTSCSQCAELAGTHVNIYRHTTCDFSELTFDEAPVALIDTASEPA